MEKFLHSDVDKFAIFVKIRISNSNLNIERGRYIKLPVEKRICPLCNIEPEDEIHFILKCPKLDECCKELFSNISSVVPSFINEFLPLIYPPELEVKETTDTASSASFLDLYLEFDDSGQFSTKIYDKRDDFNFKIINFPNMCSNIPASPAYGVYISQLIRYARASSNYSDFLKHHLHLRNRLWDQGYKKIRLIRSLKKFIFRYQDLVEIYSVSAEKIISNAFSYSENV